MKKEQEEWLAKQKLRLLEMRSLRRDVIARESQGVLLANEKEDTYWVKQHERFNLMVKRMQTAKQTCEELNLYLQKANKMMTLLANSILALGSFGTEETGSLRQAAIAHDILRKTSSQHMADMKDRVFADSVRQAGVLAKHISKRAEEMETRGNKVARAVAIQRQKVTETWNHYERSVRERTAQEAAEKPVKGDPFLACRQYGVEVAAMKKTELQYQREMTNLFMELRVDDGRRIDGIKAVMLDNLLAQKALLEHTIKFTDAAISSVKKIDREKDVLEFIRHADLLNPAAQAGDGKDSLSTVFEVPPPHRDPLSLQRIMSEELELEGKLWRPGKIIKSNWKEIYASVSKCGFFHYFDSTRDSAPAVTIPLHDCKVNVCPQLHQFAFEIVQPNSSVFSLSNTPNKYILRADNENELVNWLLAIKKYIPRLFK